MDFGRWGLATAATAWIPGSISILLLPIFGNLSFAGGYRALEIFLLPLNQTVAALSIVAIGRLANAHGDASAFRTATRVVLLSLGLLGAAYAVGLSLAGKQLVQLVYAGKYDHIAEAIWVLAPSNLFYALSTGLICILQAARRPDLTFFASAATAAVALATALCFIPLWGVTGAAWSWTTAALVSTLCLGAYARGLMQRMDAKVSV
jgi:O-antigen/teichoic acid export membrane protein